MLVGLKIIAAVVAYRVRKLEMANLAGAASIATVLHLPVWDIAYRTAFAFVLNALVYLNNDYIDIELDLRSADKDNSKARFLAANLGAALYAQLGLVAVLLVAALAYDPGLLVPLIAGGGVCLWYSAHLKRRPFVDVPAMMLWGALMPLCGTPLDSLLGLCLAIQLGLFSGVFESIQVMRDADQDGREGIRTTSVVLGKQRTLWLARVLMLASSLYALAVLHPAAAAVSALALVLPFRSDAVERYWTRVKVVYGVAWLVVCAFVFLTGHSAGLLWPIEGWARLD